ncbi:MAG: RES family NAD+ phosphorylase [Oricola sp.]
MSDFKRYDGEAWRLVEAQHRVSTMKLVDNLDEQALLEDIVEAAKPPVPEDCAHLHYLLATPFRYGAAYPHGSRFRRAGLTEGVWYGSEQAGTAVAEMAFYRLLFFAESPDTPWPRTIAEFTAIAALLKTGRMADLADRRFDAERAALEHPTDYAASQEFAERARRDGAEVIRYRSIRDPKAGANLAVLACAAFARPAPVRQETWRLRISATGVLALGPGAGDRLGFALADFAADPRIAGMIRDR